jgi:serine protease Do
MDKYIVLRHRSGSKANKIDKYELNGFTGLMFGREEDCSVRYDAKLDDLVGRKHASISADNQSFDTFSITDLSSRNGTFVNQKRITGKHSLQPGDFVQLGIGGPEFEFDLDPRPPSVPGETRMVNLFESKGIAQETRIGSIPSATPAPVNINFKDNYGKKTVELIIGRIKHNNKVTVISTVAILSAIVIALGLYINYVVNKTRADNQADQVSSNPINEAEMISANYRNSIGLIEASWRLRTIDGQPVYHEYVKFGDDVFPVFIQINNRYEPMLTLDERSSTFFSSDSYPNKLIAGIHSGTGFAISADGLILTNRHVAAAWYARYDFRPYAQNSPRSIVLLTDSRGNIDLDKNGNPKGGYIDTNDLPRDWIPAFANSLGGRSLGEKKFEGENISLMVSFPNNPEKKRAELAVPSSRADLATIKLIAIGTPISNVPQFNENYNDIRQGAKIFVMGYPGVTPKTFDIISSSDALNRETQIRERPNPALDAGLLSAIIRDQPFPGEEQSTKDSTKDITVSMGDWYQLNVNATGGGNSGGPVFDDKGKVIAVFTAGSSVAGATVTFAVPIKYAKELF